MAVLMGKIPMAELYVGRKIWVCKNCGLPLSIDSKKPSALKIASWGVCEEAGGVLNVGYHKPIWRKYKG